MKITFVCIRKILTTANVSLQQFHERKHLENLLRHYLLRQAATRLAVIEVTVARFHVVSF